MKSILILLSLVLLIALGFFYNQEKEEKVFNVQTSQKIEIMPKPIEKEKKPTPKISKQAEKHMTPEISDTPKKTTQKNHKQTLLYEPLSLEEAKLSTPPRKKVSPIGAIQIKQRMSELQPNDTLTLSDVEGSDYTLTIASVHQNNDGSTSTTAHYKDEGITYTTTITQSDKSTYITLSTANGLYEIETNADTGYIYKTDTIRKAIQSRIPDDVIMLPIPK